MIIIFTMLFVKSYEARLFFGQAKLRVRGLRWNPDGIFPNLQRVDPQVIQCLIGMLRAYIAMIFELIYTV